MQSSRSRYLQPPEAWKKKVSEGQGRQLQDIEIRVTKAIDVLATDYLTHARSELDVIERAIDTAKMGERAQQTEAIGLVRKAAFEMRNEGATLGYPLITRIGTSLCDFIDGVRDLSSVQIEAISIHLIALRFVIINDIAGEGDDSMKLLLAGIDELVAKTLRG